MYIVIVYTLWSSKKAWVIGHFRQISILFTMGSIMSIIMAICFIIIHFFNNLLCIMYATVWSRTNTPSWPCHPWFLFQKLLQSQSEFLALPPATGKKNPSVHIVSQATVSLKYPGIPWIFKFNKGKWWAPSVLQINVSYFAELVKKIFDIALPYIWG